MGKTAGLRTSREFPNLFSPKLLKYCPKSEGDCRFCLKLLETPGK